jgi:outer membrane protein OmpU
MKKILIASTALVAAGLIAGPASASEKIKLELGGYSKWWVVGAWQQNSFQSANQADYNNVDVKGDNEVWFEGSTTLDNGLQVGVHIELEAGGTTDNTADPIDKSNVFISGGFGKFIIGTEDNGAVLLHVMAPDAAANTDSDGILTGGLSIAAPAGFTNRVVTSIDTDGQAEKLTYVAPTFYGLTLGATYVPNTKEDDRGATKINNNGAVNAADVYGVGALYANTFGGVDVKVSGGFATYTVELGTVGNTQVNEFSTGTQLSYAGFTVGGSYRKINSHESLAGTIAASGTVWDAGIQYASGPYAVSFIYFDSKADRTSTLEDDFTVYQVSGKYALGAGVDVLATVGHADYDSEVVGDANSNKGWAVMTGLSLTF